MSHINNNIQTQSKFCQKKKKIEKYLKMKIKKEEKQLFIGQIYVAYQSNLLI